MNWLRSHWVIAGVAVAGVAVLLTALAIRRQPQEPPPASASVVDYLRTDAAGFARVRPRQLRFPADEGPHPAYRTEWWYYTGNLVVIEDPGAGEQGRRFGFELTFFRTALAPRAPQRSSSWATNQVYMAHFALTDVARGQFYARERMARGAAGMAGAHASPYRVWLEDWSASREEPRGAEEPVTLAPVRLTAREGELAIELLLTPSKPPVLHGERGYSRKGPEPDHASYYYSYPRLQVSGMLTTADGHFRVRGQAWMDHEWMSSALAEHQLGWDWFALQLDDGRELMLYQIRRADGQPPDASGSLVWPAEGTTTRSPALTATAGPLTAASGPTLPASAVSPPPTPVSATPAGPVGGEAAGETTAATSPVTHLTADEFRILVLDQWTSPVTGATYPSGWRVVVPGQELDLRVTPLIANQELAVSLPYWEGAVEVRGSAAGRPISGQGYVELTGY